MEYAPGLHPQSKEAYRSVNPASTETRILRFLRQRGKTGATTDEIESALGMLHQTASPAVIKLRREGRISANGVKRKTRTGRKAEVHVVR